MDKSELIAAIKEYKLNIIYLIHSFMYMMNIHIIIVYQRLLLMMTSIHYGMERHGLQVILLLMKFYQEYPILLCMMKIH